MSKRDNKEKGRQNKFNKILTLCLVGRCNDEVKDEHTRKSHFCILVRDESNGYKRGCLGAWLHLGFEGHFQFSNKESLQGFEQKDDRAGLMSEASSGYAKINQGASFGDSVSIQMKISGFLVE